MECKTLLELKQQELEKEIEKTLAYKEKFTLSLQANSELQKVELENEKVTKLLLAENKKINRRSRLLKVGLFCVSGVAVAELVHILIH